MVIGPAEASAFTYSGGTDEDDAAAAAAAAAAALDVGRNPVQAGFDVFVDVCFLVDMCHNFRVGIRDESKPMAVRVCPRNSAARDSTPRNSAVRALPPRFCRHRAPPLT